jgi:hypothetical protein
VELTVIGVTELRTGPSRNYPVTDMLVPGDKVVVNGRLSAWYRLADGRGYVLGLTLDNPSAPDAGLMWETTVVNAGDSGAVHLCAGELTEFVEASDDLGAPFYTIHGHCGGTPIFYLQPGDRVKIDDQVWEVRSQDQYPLFGSTELLKGIIGPGAFLNACDVVRGTTHIAVLDPVGTR